MGHMGKTVLVVISLVILLPVSGFSASILVSWNANTESDLAGYKIYYGTQSRTYSSPVNVGKVTGYQFNNVGTGTYYLAVTAYDTSGNESGYSSEARVNVPATQTTSSITLLTPKQGEVVKGNPSFTWSGTGMVKYSVFVTFNGSNSYNIYSGTGTSCKLPPSFWNLLVPSGTTLYWYVEGTTANSQVYKSSTFSFKKR